MLHHVLVENPHCHLVGSDDFSYWFYTRHILNQASALFLLRDVTAVGLSERQLSSFLSKVAPPGLIDTTLMSAFPSSRQVNLWLSFKRWFRAMPGRAGGTVVETTVDHTLMRGSEPHDR